ncbi:MAG: PRC-barrel domain-containing protein [Sulfitobacter sp.]
MNDMSQASPMVSSHDVNGTNVHAPDGAKIGHIDHLMIDKESGNIAYAVMAFGGFLGMGEEHHPVPWKSLRYDTAHEGFVTDITEEQLKGAPERQDRWTNDRDWEKRTFDHYGVPYYWF